MELKVKELNKGIYKEIRTQRSEFNDKVEGIEINLEKKMHEKL